MVANPLTIFNVLASASQDLVCFIPNLFGNKGRDKLTALVLEHHPFFGRQEFLLLGEHIDNSHLVTNVISLIFRIRDNSCHRAVCNFVAVIVSIPLLIKQRFKLLHTILTRSIKSEQIPHHRSLSFIDNQSLAILFISEDTAITQNNARFDCLLMSEFYTA